MWDSGNHLALLACMMHLLCVSNTADVQAAVGGLRKVKPLKSASGRATCHGHLVQRPSNTKETMTDICMFDWFCQMCVGTAQL